MGEIQDFASGVEYIARQVAESTPRDITQKGRITAVVSTDVYSVLPILPNFIGRSGEH